MQKISKKVVYEGAFWKVLERVLAQGVSLVLSIILARLIEPSEYGIISIISIFTSFADIFVLEGFSSALIQKKDADERDFSTAFYFNFFLGIVIYVIIFFLAPYVSKLYKIPILCMALRIMAVRIPLSAINSIQRAYVARNFEYKKFFRATFVGTVISGIAGIGMAFRGMGVWALLAQALVNILIDSLMLWISVKWRPIFYFSSKRLKTMLNYGMGILGYNLVMNLYDQMRNIVISKLYTKEDLAYYSRGGDIPNIIVANVNNSLGEVFFSLLSRVQDDNEKFKSYVHKYIGMSTYIISPMLIGLVVIADPLISALFTEKWLQAAIYLKIFCCGMILRPLNSANIQIMKAKGYSNVLLKMDMAIRVIGIIILLWCMKYGVYFIALSTVAISIIGSVIYSLPIKKIAGINYFDEIKKWLQGIFPAIVMGIFLEVLNNCIARQGIFFEIVFPIFLGLLFYIIISIVLHCESFYELKRYIDHYKK